MRATVLAFVGLLLLFAACIQQSGSPPAPTPTSPIVEETAPAPKPAAQKPAEPCSSGTILDKDDCFAALASTSGKSDWCNSIYSTGKKDVCIYGFAKTNGELCGNLFSSALRADCYTNYAKAKGDYKLCDLVGDSQKRQECLKALSPPCSFETDEFARGACLSLAKSDPNYCRDSSCLINYAKNKSDEPACALISGTEAASRYACIAVAKSNADECSKTSNSIIGDFCYQIYALYQNDLGACDLGTLGSPYRNGCYVYFANKRLDSSVCKKPYPETEKDQCYLNYSVAQDSPSTCEKVINSLVRNKCYITTAKANANPTACIGLLTKDRQTCYNIVFTGPGVSNPSYCAAIGDSFWMDKCYINAAANTLNSSICNSVQDPDQKKKCLSPFGG